MGEKKTLLGYDVKVHNVAYEKSGKVHDSGDLIYAKIVDAKTGKLEVAPSFLPAGLWIFTRQQRRDEALVQKVRQMAQSKGFDLSVLNDVDQSNCPALPSTNALIV